MAILNRDKKGDTARLLLLMVNSRPVPLWNCQSQSLRCEYNHVHSTTSPVVYMLHTTYGASGLLY